jgi:hypothetical protein
MHVDPENFTMQSASTVLERNQHWRCKARVGTAYAVLLLDEVCWMQLPGHVHKFDSKIPAVSWQSKQHTHWWAWWSPAAASNGTAAGKPIQGKQSGIALHFWQHSCTFRQEIRQVVEHINLLLPGMVRSALCLNMPTSLHDRLEHRAAC